MRKFALALVLLLLPQLTEAAQPPHFGTTFSAKQCEYFDLDWKETYLAILELPFDVIRLGAYWDEIEPREGEYDFSKLDWQIRQAKERNIPVVLTVGIKAPRWPEFHIPEWIYETQSFPSWSTVSKNAFLQEKALAFIEEVFKHYRRESTVHYWQIENEALNRFGGYRWVMDEEFLRKEVALMRSLDPHRPIVLTASTYPNPVLRFVSQLFTDTEPIRQNLELGDVLGVNIYPIFGQSMLGWNWYLDSGKSERDRYFKEILRKTKDKNKDIWVTELQAEPWEPGHLVYKDKKKPPTGWAERTKQMLAELHGLGYRTFLFWGAEYWYYQKHVHGQDEWWLTIEKLIRKYKPGGD